MPPSNQFPSPYTPPPQQPGPPQPPMPPVQPAPQFPQPMPPQQPMPAQPGQSPYDFFMEDGSNRRSSYSGGNNQKKWIFLGAVGAFLAIVLVAIFALAFGGSNAPSPLVSIISDQQEIIRIATDGSKNSKTTKLQNFSITTQLTMTSAQRETTALAAKLGTEVTEKQLAASVNATTTQQLASALAVNTYDTTYATVMTDELNKYEKHLTAAYAQAASDTERKLLKKNAAAAELLRKQLNAQ
jgi:hypothetical protein